jgi:hypothetical protein
MSRVLALGLCAALSLAGAGCSQDGRFVVAWVFGTQGAAAGCGQHGVDSILVTATDTTGDGTQALALCTPGQLIRAVPAGSWTIQLQAIDLEGALIPSLAAVTMPAIAVVDGAVTPVTLSLTPLPACGAGDGGEEAGAADAGCADGSTGTPE